MHVFVKKKFPGQARNIEQIPYLSVHTPVVSARPEKQSLAFVAFPIAGPMIQKRSEPFRRAGAFQFEAQQLELLLNLNVEVTLERSGVRGIKALDSSISQWRTGIE
jgi:hypothetical protein